MMEIKLSQPYSFCQLGKRVNQEDARFPDSDVPSGYPRSFVVCDGVGGEECGEVASRTVADTIGRCMADFDPSGSFDVKAFRKILNKVGKRLDAASGTRGAGMATTLTFLCFHSGGAFAAHCGDSRIYHIRPSVGILYRSADHSLVNALVHSGNISPEQAIDHPQGNVITRCLRPSRCGEAASVATLQIQDIVAGDYFLLCTDGVLHSVEETTLLQILSSDVSDLEKIRLLATLSAGSSDNNTAYLIRVEQVKGSAFEEDSEVKTDEGGNGGVDTAPLGRPNAVVIETGESVKESIGSRIKNLFGKIF